MRADLGELPSDRLGRQDKIHATTINRTVWHTSVSGRGLVLSERDAAEGLDFAKSQGTVGARTRQYYSDGPALLFSGERAKKMINRQMQAARFRARGHS